MALGIVKQQNIAVNRARHLIFFEGTELAYNYKTQQWTRVPAYANLGVFSVNNKSRIVGLVRFSGNAVDLQDQVTGNGYQEAKFTSSARQPNETGRGIVNGVRPRSNGGTHSVRVGTQDDIDDTVSWSTSTSVNSRTNMANFRSEGRYVRIEDTISTDFTTAMGADIDFAPQGFV